MGFKFSMLFRRREPEHHNVLVRRLAKMCYYAYQFSQWQEALSIITALWHIARKESNGDLQQYYQSIIGLHQSGHYKEARKLYCSIYKTILSEYK